MYRVAERGEEKLGLSSEYNSEINIWLPPSLVLFIYLNYSEVEHTL